MGSAIEWELQPVSLVPPKSPGQPMPARQKGAAGRKQDGESRGGDQSQAQLPHYITPIITVCLGPLYGGIPLESTHDFPNREPSIIFPPCATASVPPPFVPHTAVWRLREKDNIADLGWGVVFSSGNAGPLHSILPHPL